MNNHPVNANQAMLTRLAATAPHPDHTDRLRLFGQFVGSWDVQVTTYTENGATATFPGEWHFGWVLDGRAVQDVLVTSPPTDRNTPQGGPGCTLRVYDPVLDAWWVTWADPTDRQFCTLFARQVGERILLDGQWSLRGRAGRRFEWSFNDITADSFHWKGRVSHDDGHSWLPTEEMLARRR